jgi:hypothetical protein
MTETVTLLEIILQYFYLEGQYLFVYHKKANKKYVFLVYEKLNFQNHSFRRYAPFQSLIIKLIFI